MDNGCFPRCGLLEPSPSFFSEHESVEHVLLVGMASAMPLDTLAKLSRGIEAKSKSSAREDQVSNGLCLKNKDFSSLGSCLFLGICFQLSPAAGAHWCSLQECIAKKQVLRLECLRVWQEGGEAEQRR